MKICLITSKTSFLHSEHFLKLICIYSIVFLIIIYIIIFYNILKKLNENK